MTRFPKIIGVIIYFFVLITSFYHVFKFYEIFESENESFIAFFVAFGFELSVLYFAYIYTKYKFTSSKHALTLSLFIVWFGNIFVMTRNVWAKTFEVAILNTDASKIILPLIGSIFIPVGSYFLGKIMANLDVERAKEKEIVQTHSTESCIPTIISFTDCPIEQPITPISETIFSLATNINIVYNIEPIEDIAIIQNNVETAEEHEELPEYTEPPKFHFTETELSEVPPPLPTTPENTLSSQELDDLHDILSDIHTVDLGSRQARENVRAKLLKLFNA